MERRNGVFTEPLSFEPLVVAKPWGGRDRLRRLGVAVPEAPPTGEVWLVSDVEARPSVVTSGKFAGRTLRDLVRDHPRELLGRFAGPGDQFPLLVKLLEVEGKLSVQVHPDGGQARRNGDGPAGKFEAWAVIDASPQARVSLGLDRPLSADEVRALVGSERLAERLYTFPPTAGDAYVIAPGTIHAATGGLLFLEVQETADVTYRLYDWGTRGLDGRPRDLHVEKALACADLAREGSRPPPPAARTVSAGVRVRPIVTAGHGPFSFDLLELDPGARTPAGGEGAPWIYVSLSGAATLTGAGSRVELMTGRGVLWPAALEPGELQSASGAVVARARPL